MSDPDASTPTLVVAGVGSGVGKTTTLIALAGAFAKRGLEVVTFKCGPDYLDPTYHARVTGRPAQNLDGWMMGEAVVRQTFARASARADLVLIEGVMGLFDGAAADSEAGSTAQIAKWLDAPVLLCVDASGMARTIAAISHGFTHFDPDLRLEAITANWVGSPRHLEILRTAAPAPPIVGGFPKRPELAFPRTPSRAAHRRTRRHLGRTIRGLGRARRRILRPRGAAEHRSRRAYACARRTSRADADPALRPHRHRS